MFVWLLESVLLGSWALGLVQVYFTNFHMWLVIYQLLVAGFSLAAYYLATAVGMGDSVGRAVALTHMCAMTFLLTVYIGVILDSTVWDSCFASSVLGVLPVGASIGISIVTVMFFASTCMYLSNESYLRSQQVGVYASKQPPMPLLILNPYANSTCVLLPMLMLLYLYGGRAVPETFLIWSIITDGVYAVLTGLLSMRKWFPVIWVAFFGSRITLFVVVWIAFVAVAPFGQQILAVVLAGIYGLSVLLEFSKKASKLFKAALKTLRQRGEENSQRDPPTTNNRNDGPVTMPSAEARLNEDNGLKRLTRYIRLGVPVSDSGLAHAKRYV
jgi:hypothetical protein